MPTTDTQAIGHPTVNPDLKAVHTQLIALAQSLDSAVGRATTAAEVNAILDELIEVNARVTMVGRQLFTRQTEQIEAASKAVIDAKGQAEHAIDELDHVQKFITGITQFLGIVDKLVDLAKLVI